MQNFQEYPKHMNHPAFRPAVVVKWDPKIKEAKDQKQGSSAKFPPVVVHNLDQEQYYASLGYKPNGVSDAAAYSKAMAGNATTPEGKNIQFPKWLYQADESEETGVKSKLVNNADEQKQLGAGWHATPDLARTAGTKVEEKKTEEPVVKKSVNATIPEAPAPVVKAKKVVKKLAKKAKR